MVQTTVLCQTQSTMRLESYAFLVLIVAGCAGPGDGRLPSPKRGLIKAREATLSGTPQERAAAHRRVIELCLDEGWSDEAAIDYLALRELVGEDEILLESVAWGALGIGLRAPDPARRLRTAQALAELSPDPQALGLLERALADPHPEVQVVCAQALCRAGWSHVLRTLEACDERSAPAARRAALLAAAREVRAGLADAGALEAALPSARRALERGPDRVRLAALEFLGALPALPEALDLLEQGVAQADPEVSQRAAVALAAHDAERALAAWTSTQLSRSPALDAFARALRVHGGGPTAQVELDLVSDDARIRRATLRGLQGPGAARVAVSLHALIESPARTTRLQALGISRRWAPLPAPTLRALWTHPDAATRVAAFTSAAEQQPLGIDALQPLWEADDSALAPAIAAHLATEGPGGLELLEAGLARPATSRPALRALRRRPEARARFQALLDSPDAEARRLGAAGLVHTAARDDLLPLLEGMTSLRADTDVLCAAAVLSAIQAPASPSVE